MTIYFEINEKPTPKQSVKFSKFGAFCSAKVKNFAKKVQLSYLECNNWIQPEIITEPVEVQIIVNVKISKSFNKLQKEKALNGEIKPVKRPDVDNIAKGILDPLNGFLWQDDKQVFKLSIEKKYSDEDKIQIKVIKYV